MPQPIIWWRKVLTYFLFNKFSLLLPSPIIEARWMGKIRRHIIIDCFYSCELRKRMVLQTYWITRNSWMHSIGIAYKDRKVAMKWTNRDILFFYEKKSIVCSISMRWRNRTELRVLSSARAVENLVAPLIRGADPSAWKSATSGVSEVKNFTNWPYILDTLMWRINRWLELYQHWIASTQVKLCGVSLP